MLDMWHTLLQDLFTGTPWQEILSEHQIPGLPQLQLPDGWNTLNTKLWGFTLDHDGRASASALSTGKKYRALRALSKACAFETGIKPRYEYKVSLTSRKQLERYDFDRYFLEEYGRNAKLSAVVTSAANNEKKYRKYKADAETLLGVKSGDAAKVRLFDSLEVKLCKRRLLKPPVSPVFHCTAEYISPKGQNHASRTADYTLKQLKAIAEQHQKNVDFEASKAYQRKLMTDSLRYDVMKRDNFRCVLCGRSAQEGVKLHVDHILPVAKGGKTVPENLRTLCDQCNLGKSDKYDPKGAN